MKKNLLIVSLLFLTIFLTPLMAHAQSADCSTINSQSTFNTCCTGVNPNSDVGVRCTNYYYTVAVPAAQNQCSTVDITNYDSCCTGVNPNTATGIACTEYYNSDGSVPGQVGGGSQTTSPVNNGSSTSYGTTTGTTADQQALATCSAIQFVNLLDIAIWAKCLISSFVIPGIFTLAFVVFLWGVFKFIRSSEQKDRQESKQFIYMGLIGLFVMTSVWGIIRIFSTTLGLGSAVPTLQTEYLDTSKADKK